MAEPDTASWRYTVGGFTLHAQRAMPMLPEATCDEGLLGRIAIERGPIPLRIDGAELAPGVTASPHELLAEIPAIGRLWIRDGTRIVAAAAPGVDDADLQPFILGSGIGAICHQRGLLPLHGSAVAADARASVFLGPRGAGKSTMMASLLRAGFAPLADDLTIVGALAERSGDRSADCLGDACANDLAALSGIARLRVFSGVPRIKLWPDVAVALGIGERGATREMSSSAKLQIPFPSAGAAPVELGGIYLLDEAETLTIERLSADDATQCLLPHVYRRSWVLPGRPTLQRIVMLRRIARGIPVFRLARPKRLDLLPRLAELVREHAARRA